ncbi:unnamed protein product [Mytilus coruscus]|uniref:Uncharacterized protein n=1 Tax=Mytilus coruscus TaxID=42192 RepID=A0A6J8A149_MYTCO|nr:unnamed protein product [Mytilus coruscus]
MLLERDLKFNSQMLLDLIMRFHQNEHYDQLNSFKENENLRTLDIDTLKLRLEKSLGIKIDDLVKMLNRDLNRPDFVKIAHIGIIIANEEVADEMEPPRKKKKKRSEKPNVPSSTCADSLLKNKDTINDRISELESLLQSTKDSKQKDSLRDSLASFLFNLDPKRTLDDALPSDVRGYFFRPLASSQNEILDAPFSSSAANARLKLYLKELDLWEGETPHSARKIEILKKSLNVDVVAQDLREVKEYAARSSEINVDTMQLKLVHLDEVARKVNDSNRELYSMVSDEQYLVEPRVWEFSDSFKPYEVVKRCSMQYANKNKDTVKYDDVEFDPVRSR